MYLQILINFVYLLHREREFLGASQLLSLFLMIERMKDCLSEWNPYINMLPSTYNIPLYWSDKCISLLPQSSQILAQQQHNVAYSQFNQLKLVYDRMSTGLSFQRESFTWELFKWAWSTVNTRCVYLRTPDMEGLKAADCIALVPFLDLFNHSSTARVNIYVLSFSNLEKEKPAFKPV